jgi:hypothetical protein
MIFLMVLFGLWAATIFLQWRLLRQHALWRRASAFVVCSLLFASLLPPLLHWQQLREVPVEESGLGILIWDSSASCEAMAGEQRDLVERLEQRGGLEVVPFSSGLCAPFGQAIPGGGSDLGQSLEQLKPSLTEWAPDWVWILSDGGFVDTGLPPWLMEQPVYFSAWDAAEQGDDIGVVSLDSDPVWYARHDSDLRIVLDRNSAAAEARVDLLVHMNGSLVKTAEAVFAPGQVQAELEVTLKAEHLGTTHVEVQIAEGQGGRVLENDHRHLSLNVLRDRVRILRVVGRPNWSSKFLRDQLVKREDVDLVDFHILRAMQDRVQASTRDLALIPFPVKELFVENIDSFDLIIWQNFDHRTYPFFKEEFVANIVKAVDSGCGLLLWSGSRPWTLERGGLAGIAPLASSGKHSVRVEGLMSAAEQSTFRSLGYGDFSVLGQRDFRVYGGRLKDDGRVLLACADQPLISSRSQGRGRVMQVSCDDLWRLKFDSRDEAHGLYDAMLKCMLMWLQHHPSTEVEPLPWPAVVEVGAELSVVGDSLLSWSDGEGQPLVDPPVADDRIVKAPSQPGLYRVRDERGLEQVLAVKGLQDEFMAKAQREEVLESWRLAGAQALDAKSGWPLRAEPPVFQRSLGRPWHVSPLYLAAVIALLVLNWLVLGRALELGVVAPVGQR